MVLRDARDMTYKQSAKGTHPMFAISILFMVRPAHILMICMVHMLQSNRSLNRTNGYLLKTYNLVFRRKELQT